MTTNKPGTVTQQPLYGCTSCYEDCTYTATDLRVYDNECWCEECWDIASYEVSGGIDWTDLAPFKPALQAECERLYAALRHMASMYGVDDYFSGKLRDKEIDRAVNSALESVMPTCKRDKKPCGKTGGYCLECPSGPRREWMSK